MMATDTVQQIKDKLTIVEIVTPYVKLTRAGKSLTGLCPFHKDKTPSFHVSVERGTWHCFGCGEGGDGFSFIEKIEGVDFKGALKILAEKAGVHIEYSHGENHEAVSRKERMRDVMNRASEWYAERFAGSLAAEYATRRGIGSEATYGWHLGFAPEAWRALLEAMTALGFTTDELLAAGLIKEADGKPGIYYDRFRNRLMFPIRDVAGRVVAFTGRTLNPEEQAKYLNSPDTELYHKSEILFGLDRAKDAIRTRGFVILVEGQMDVLLAHQAGFTNTIALSGTALSDKHIALIKRYSDNLMLVLDADDAGFSATAKSAELALRFNLRVKAVKLPAWKDPADLVSEDPKLFASCIAEAKPIVHFFLGVLAEKEHDSHRLVPLVERIVLPLINAISSPMEREHFIQDTARALGLSTEAVRESLRRIPATSQGSTFDPHSKGRTLSVAGQTLTRAPVRSALERRGELLLAVVHAYADTPLAERVKMRYLQITEADQLPDREPQESLLFEAEQLFGEDPEEEAADELLYAFEETVIRDAYQEAVARLRRAESAGDAASIAHAQVECAKISSRLAALGVLK